MTLGDPQSLVNIKQGFVTFFDYSVVQIPKRILLFIRSTKTKFCYNLVKSLKSYKLIHLKSETTKP